MQAGKVVADVLPLDENFFTSRNCYDDSSRITHHPPPTSTQIIYHNPQYYSSTPSPTTPSPTPFTPHNSVNLHFPTSKRLRASYSTGSIHGTGVNHEFPTTPPPRVLSLEKQNEFNHDICHLFVGMGVAFNGVNHPELHQFMSKWVPGSILPSDRTLSGTLLESEASKVIERTKIITSGQLANYQCDGWKNVSKTAVITSMIVVNYVVRFRNMT